MVNPWRRGLITNPSYDSSMFLAYLTIVPALVLFVVSIETRFFEQYITFYADIQNHATLQRIRQNHKLIMSVRRRDQKHRVVQGIICYLAILVAPGLIGLANGGIELVSIFRFGILGAFFHTLLLFAMSCSPISICAASFLASRACFSPPMRS